MLKSIIEKLDGEDLVRIIIITLVAISTSVMFVASAISKAASKPCPCECKQ